MRQHTGFYAVDGQPIYQADIVAPHPCDPRSWVVKWDERFECWVAEFTVPNEFTGERRRTCLEGNRWHIKGSATNDYGNQSTCHEQ